MFNPNTTYRLQFHKAFSFEAFQDVIAYLKQLGVATIYASPVFASVTASVHGYDGTSPHQVNPEIGNEEQWRSISAQLKQSGIGWLQDIVPNHMAFHPKNEWLMDLLEKGTRSRYFSFFDILWESKVYGGRLMVPFLGKPLAEVINEGELKVVYDNDQLALQYYDVVYPLSVVSYARLFPKRSSVKEIKELMHTYEETLATNDTGNFDQQWQQFRQNLATHFRQEKYKTALVQTLQKINRDPATIKEVVEEQYYQLCFWQETDHTINYRRFFTINGLICLNIQEEEVFDVYHHYIKQLWDEGMIQGLRVDHIDGLYDPVQYLNRLRHLAGPDAYITVEKILEPGEELPPWPVEGTTGYDFLASVNNLLTNQNNASAFTRFYQQLTGDRRPVPTQIYDKKSAVLDLHMQGELNNLYQLFLDLKLVDKRTLSNIHPDDLKEAIGEMLVQCPVYRLYPAGMPLADEEAGLVHQILQQAKRSGSSAFEAVELLEQVFLHKPHEGDPEYNSNALHFLRRCMQFSGPLMAKGVEDTLMYTYNRFVAHNEVGDAPDAFGISIDEFHERMKKRLELWPLAMNATATHDTKRGEDVRALLNVLSDLPHQWFAAVQEWQQLNAHLKVIGAPDANDEYFIYQSLIGAYPFIDEDVADFESRFHQYLEKALREGKIHSGWTAPDEQYEAAVKTFASSLLQKDKPFWNSFNSFREKIIDHGMVNALSQVVLKFACPGVADTYQGCELWDLSFVDPDNRRPVDYQKRTTWLKEISEGGTDAESLWQTRHNGRIKLWLVHQLMQLRKDLPDVFTEGTYIPLQVEGAYKTHIIAFARKHRQQCYVFALPLHTAAIAAEQGVELSGIDWKDTIIRLPKNITENLIDMVSEKQQANKKGLLAGELFAALPFAILKAHQNLNERGAGVLMHLSSLPSAYGIGDMGTSAYDFADFLYRTRQKFWQLLPLNPTEEGQAHSPYSATSAMAGNPLFIAPDLLAAEGLLEGLDLQALHLPVAGQVNFEAAASVRNAILDHAFTVFTNGSNEAIQEEFQSFKQAQASWLEDFVRFSLLKQVNGGKPWYEWDESARKRKSETLTRLELQYSEELEKIRFIQFLFARQWQALKAHCNARGIRLIGDLPFYVSYDSADVWAQPELFAIDEEGRRTGMAGVPPDAFSADGQLWGMPVFRWDVLKERAYDWWIQRLKKNGELFDLVRLDHFRAFAAYWEVPANETTARNGSWQKGPGAAFFKAVQEELGALPFVAEDLGDIDEDVLTLRDQFHLPGMKVLQFAFGEDMAQSDYIPHNYSEHFIVYTGTHDNNTTRGWFTTEASDDVRLRVESYIGHPVSAAEIHLELARLAYASVADMVILPLQDILGLDEAARMNMPSSAENNWAWQLTELQLLSVHEDRMRKWTRIYNRE